MLFSRNAPVRKSAIKMNMRTPQVPIKPKKEEPKKEEPKKEQPKKEQPKKSQWKSIPKKKKQKKIVFN